MTGGAKPVNEHLIVQRYMSPLIFIWIWFNIVAESFETVNEKIKKTAGSGVPAADRWHFNVEKLFFKSLNVRI